MEPLIEYLNSVKPLIDKQIERVMPRKVSAPWLAKAIGRPRYSYDLDAVQKGLLDPAWDFLDRGGKRWRPALMLLTCEATGGSRSQALPLTPLPELIHNGTIIVDDVEDGSPTRRGKPALHKLFGVDIAVNAGNTLYFLPLILLYKNLRKLPYKTLLKIYDLYSQEMLCLSVGQAMDIYWHRHPELEVSEEQYLQMCLCKTGVLARFSAKLGAILASASQKQVDALGRFAESIGVAFQIQDDILNLKPASAGWGKKVGEDISEGKHTLLTVHALRTLPNAKARTLRTLLAEKPKDRKRIARAIALIEESGAMEYAKQKAATIAKNGWRSVARVLPRSGAKELLKAFADFVISRKI